MTLVELTLVTAWLLAALWTLYVLVLRHLESDPGGWEGYDAADDESTRTAWLHALANTGSAVERRIAREFKRRGRLLLGPRRATEAKRAKARRNGGAR